MTMRRRMGRLAVLLLLSAAAVCADAIVVRLEKPDVAAAPPEPRQWVPTHTKAHMLAFDVANDVGALPDTENVHVVVALKLRDQAALDAVTQRIASTVSAPVLTPQQFMERHAPTREQAVRVVNYLRAHGFQHVTMADNRLLVSADGTPTQVRRAFKAELHRFDVHGRRAYANVTDALVPDTLADAVLAITGLQTVHMAHTMLRHAEPQAVAPQSVVGVSPPLFPGIYGASGMPSATTSTIGIVTQGSMTQTITDLNSFASSAGYHAPPVRVVTVGSASTDTSGVDEWNMDTQASLAAAGGTVKSILLYTANTLSDADLTSTYNKVVSDNLAKVINVSLGECETSAKSSGTEASND